MMEWMLGISSNQGVIMKEQNEHIKLIEISDWLGGTIEYYP